jgi:hypothetical protein
MEVHMKFVKFSAGIAIAGLLGLAACEINNQSAEPDAKNDLATGAFYAKPKPKPPDGGPCPPPCPGQDSVPPKPKPKEPPIVSWW